MFIVRQDPRKKILNNKEQAANKVNFNLISNYLILPLCIY